MIMKSIIKHLSSLISPLSSRKGFTLVELLIAMAIISILATGLIMVINPVVQIQKASDSRRKADIAQIQKALEAYYQDNGAYPASSGGYIAPGGSVILWGDPWPPYMGNLPKDPKFPAKDYAYYAPPAFSGQTYYLYASLDRENDSQACNGGTDCESVPSANQCGGKPCNYGISTPDVDVAMGVLPPIAEESPLAGLSLSALATGSTSDYNVGYKFTVNKNGKITKLRLRCDEKTRPVRLYNMAGTVLATVNITANGKDNWVAEDIAPVDVISGASYVVATRNAPSPTKYCWIDKSGLFPYIAGNITINEARSSPATDSIPTKTLINGLFGLVDITFQPNP